MAVSRFLICYKFSLIGWGFLSCLPSVPSIREPKFAFHALELLELSILPRTSQDATVGSAFLQLGKRSTRAFLCSYQPCISHHRLGCCLSHQRPLSVLFYKKDCVLKWVAFCLYFCCIWRFFFVPLDFGSCFTLAKILLRVPNRSLVGHGSVINSRPGWCRYPWVSGSLLHVVSLYSGWAILRSTLAPFNEGDVVSRLKMSLCLFLDLWINTCAVADLRYGSSTFW